MDPLYALILAIGFGPKGLEFELDERSSFVSKGSCEVELEQRLNDARAHGGLHPDGVRFGGACVLMEAR